MLMNFALESLGTTVSSDKVSVDGHECTNLISSNYGLKRKGYLAEYFIRPPVNITFHFACNINIHKVVLLPSVGQQKSNLLELLSASQPQSVKHLRNNEVNKCKGEEGNFSLDRSFLSSQPAFYSISKVFTNGEETCFYNPKVGSVTSNNETCKKLIAMKQFRPEILSASSHLSIKILTTVSGSAAALSKIDIWGYPSNSVPTDIKQTICSKYINCFKPDNDSATAFQNKPDKIESDIDTDTNPTHKNIEIPEDFLDSLTWEVMTIPIMLPSGKNIDKSTLDTYISNETSFCRKARDPFTGVEFSDSIKPLPNGALKARIDQFLMKHSHLLGNIPRTVNDGLKSLLGKRKAIEQRANQEVSSCTKDNHNNGKVNLTSFKTYSKTLPDTLCQETSTSTSKISSHEAKLKESLNLALFSVLHDSPCLKSEINSPAEETKCCCCVEVLSNESLSYLVPCSHIVCRKCLFNSPSSLFLCNICNLSFEKKMLIRKHIC